MDEEANHHLDRWIAMTSRAGVLAAQMAQVNADLVELATELVQTRTWAGDGVRSPEHWLMVYCALSPARASEVIALAQRPEQMTFAPIFRTIEESPSAACPIHTAGGA